ncbi:AEC family transporter [Treponema sp.]|uniref:AEC family transporter n=1 Tax=Treponema sp. TaxID=166 RepID=UPI00388CFCC2
MTILQTIIPVFLIIALGKILSAKKILSDVGISNIKNLCVTVLLPVMAFDALIHGTYSRDSILLILLEFFMLFSAWGVGFALKRFFDISIRDYIPYCLTTYEGGLFGWALISILVGPDNLYYIVSMDIFSGVFGFTVMYIGYKLINGEKPSKKEIVLSIAKNPLIISVILGFGGAFLGLGKIIDQSEFAGLYNKIITMFTAPLTSLILISIGAGLVFDRTVLSRGAVFTLVRYTVQTIICLIVLIMIDTTIGLNRVLFTTLLMYFSCPPSFLVSIYSRKKEAVEFTSAIISLQIIVALCMFSVLLILSMGL